MIVFRRKCRRRLDRRVGVFSTSACPAERARDDETALVKFHRGRLRRFATTDARALIDKEMRTNLCAG